MVDGQQAAAAPGAGATPQAGAEPVAVIGIGCRFPGEADTPEAFWQLLLDNRNTAGEVPPERWRPYEELGPEYSTVLRRALRKGSFLEGIDQFDAEFFGISPREAELMDPQQRILVEVVWEALEHAGIPPRALAGTDAGVFVGACTDDYRRFLLEDLTHMDAWSGIGAARCATANRVSHLLDLRGPSLAVDTACSASLVALHLACQSLRLGESSIALVGGVNLVISPGETLTLDLAGALAPDGRSKAFDASGDGYGRGEGCGVLVLKPLERARADGDRVLAVVRGSAVNQDGYTNGIMAPCGTAQEYVMARACDQAGLAPGTVDYVEAHGTGTQLGDPMEASAIGAVYGTGRPGEAPCLIGSVKANIGHLEGAAGVAGLIKATLALAHGHIPGNPLVTGLNTEIPWESTGLRVVTRAEPWPERDHPRRAGVSGFGYGGTIAHVVLEEPPAPDPVPAGQPDAATAGRTHGLYPLSAGSAPALRRQAAALADRLERPEATGGDAPDDEAERTLLRSLGHTLAHRRSPLGHRAALAAEGRQELTAALRALAADEQADGLTTGEPLTEPGKGLVWVFSGHGSQWEGMGRELLATEPPFAEVIDTLEPIFRQEIGFSPRQALTEGDFGTVDRIQCMIFATQVGLAAVWRSYGVQPDAVIGHSVGEIAAAVTSGALSLQDGGRLICRRSLLLRRVAGKGAMAMAGLTFEEAARRLDGNSRVGPAIASSPVSTVIAGDPDAVADVVSAWQAEGVVVRKVASDVAFHSAHMDPLLDELAAAATGLDTGSAQLPAYTTALADPRSHPVLDGAYWAANLRSPVRLAAAVTAAAEDGYRAFLEISPHPVVTHSVSETLSERGIEDAFVGGTLRRNRPERQALLTAIGAAHCHGRTVDWSRLQPSGGLLDVPTMAWQHRSHWRDPRYGASGAAFQHDPDTRTLLGAATTVAGSGIQLWRTTLDDDNRPYPGSHTINGVEIVPAAVMVESFFRTVSDDPATAPVLTALTMRQPLMTGARREVQILREGTALRLASRACPEDEAPGTVWLTHAEAELAPEASTAPAPLTEVTEAPERLESAAEAASLPLVDNGLVHQRLSAVGVPSTGFTWTVEELRRGEGRLRGRVRCARDEGATPGWAPVLDAVMTLAPVTYPGDPVLRMVVEAGEISTLGAPPETVVVEIAVRAGSEDAVDVLVRDTSGAPVAHVKGLVYAVIGQEESAVADPARLVHTLAWRPVAEQPQPAEPVRDLVLAGAHEERPALADALRKRWSAAGRGCVTAASGADGIPSESLAAGADVLLIAEPGPGGAPDEAALGAAETLLATARRLSREPGAASPRLWLLTSGLLDGSDEASLVHSASAGLGRALAAEYPDVWGGVIDAADGSSATAATSEATPDATAEATAATVAAILVSGAPDSVTVLREGQALTARLTCAEGELGDSALECRADGTYLVTGGLTPEGLEAARRLAERGARRLVLAGPEHLPPRPAWEKAADAATRLRIGAVRELEASGVTVRALPLNAGTDGPEEVGRRLDALELPPVRGVVHTLPSVADMAPALAGAWLVHRLFPPGSLDFLLLSSSCGPLLGLPGEPGEGAAAGFLEALAAHRAALDTRDVTLCLSRLRPRATEEALRERGVGAVPAAEVWEVWDAARRLGPGAYTAVRTFPPRSEDGRALPPVLADLTFEEEAQHVEGDAAPVWSELSPEQLAACLTEEVGAQIALEMKLPPDDLDPRRSLVEQGLDSVLTIMVRRRLEKRFGHKLPATLLWQKPTVQAIAGHLADLLTEPEEAPETGGASTEAAVAAGL